MARGGNSQGRFTQQNIEASALDDFLNAQQGDESLSGGDGEDRFFGGRGDDVINGGLGFDTAIYSGDSSNYQITATADGLTITALTRRGREGSDTLSSIERLEFADGNFLFVDGKLVKEVPPAPTPEPIPEPIPEAPREPAPDTTATTPSLTVSAASGNEDTAIALNIAAALGDLDGSETLSITLSGVPQGVTLSAGTNNGNGSWTLTAAQLAGLKLTPKANSDADFTLTVTATATESNGGAQATKTVQLPVTVNAIADKPTLTTSPASGNEDTAIALNIAAALGDLDGSETLSITVSGVPQGATLSAGANNGNGSWTLTVAQLSGLKITPPANYSGTINLQLTATAKEGSGGSTATTTGSLAVNVNAVADAPTLVTQSSSGVQDQPISINPHIVITLNDTDGSETLSVTISGLPQGASLTAGTKNADGSWTLTPQQLTGLAVNPPPGSTDDFTLTVTAITREANGSTAQTSQPLLVTVDEAPSGGGSTLPPPSTSGNIVGLKLQNKTGSAEESGYVTFGQTFVEGQVAANGKLVAIINGQQYAVQMDVKATWDDGSVRHATLTFKAPIVAANSSVDVMLAHGSATATGSVITPSAVLAGGLDLKVALTLHNSNGTNTNLTIDAAQVLQQAISAGKVETWMQGTQAGEYRVSTTINNSLKVIFDIRMTADGEFRTDVVFSNENTFTSGVGTVNYDVTIREGGQVVFSDTNISHYRYANWHTTVWSDAEPATFLVRDVNYLIKTGALPGYDTTIPISSSTISSWLSKLAAADTEPLGNSLILENMYAPGGRPDIGPETAWTTAFLLAQSEASWSIVEANADAAGSIPWHYIDEKTGTYVRVDNNPNVWLRSGSGGGWSADNAHAPSLTYVAYLLTGDHYYLEELQARASWAIALHDPNLYGDDTRHFDGGQIRARAWDLRDLAYAAFATPDSDPLKAYYVEQLEFVLDRFVDKYVVGGFRDAAGEIEGYLSDGNAVAPWQNDFVVIVLGQLSAMGFEQADVLMEWMSNFVVGRFINAEAGFNPLAGPGYWWDNTYNGQMIDTWAELYQVNYGSSSTPTTLLGYPDWSGGYAANAKAAIATVINTLGSADAIEAYGFIVGETAKMLGSYQSDPTWAITPQFSDGSYLSVANTKVLSSTSGGTLAGTAANELLHGNDGSDTVTGGAGIDWVYGGNGNDVLSGDAGNDYLFGNFGNDRITGGTGNDYMKGGAGADTFVFASGDIGQDSISDFKPGTDRLEIKANLNGNGLSTASSILATATQDSAGNAVLHLGGDDTVTLLGVSTQQLGTSSIVIT